MSRTTALRAALAVALSLACSSRVDIPADAKLTCNTAAECPSGAICHAGRCLQPGQFETTPPALAQVPTVSPPTGAAGAVFTISLVATEPLGDPPRVLLRLASPVELTCAGTGAAYTCSYTATGAENDHRGGIVPFDVTMIDRSRNEAVQTFAGALNLDFTAPAAAAPTLSPSGRPAPLGGLVQVFFTASEPLAARPVLVASRALGGQTRFPLDPQAGTLNYPFAHVVTVQDGSAGAVQFSVELTDLAGNSATLPLGAVDVDPVAPAITLAPPSPARVGKTGTVTVGFTVSEPVADVRASLGPREMTCAPAGSQTAWTCTWPMLGTEIGDGAEEPQAVVVEVADAAGNRDLVTSRVVFDFAPPTLGGASLPATVPLGGDLVVVLTPTEALGPAPQLVASRPLWTGAGFETTFPLTADAGTLSYRFSHRVAAQDPAGPVTFSVGMTDVAGNALTSVVGTIQIDNVVPEISAVAAAPSRVGPGDTLTVTFHSTEAAAPGSLAVTVGGRALECGPYSQGSASYTCTRTVAGSDIGANTESAQSLSVSLADVAGNRAAGTGTAVIFDFKAPALAGASAEPQSVPLGGVLLVSFTPDEDLGPNPVLVASRPLDQSGETQFTLTPQPGTRTYLFTHLVTTDDLSGPVTFTAELTDLVGNAATGIPVGSATLDTLAPLISSLTVSPARIGRSGPLTATFDVDGAVTRLAVTVGGRAMTCGPASGAPPSYTCTREMVGDEIQAGTDAVQPVVVSLSDPAGNPARASDSTVFDFRAPRLAAQSAGPAGVPLGGTLLVTFTTDEDLGPKPVLVANRALDEPGGTRFTLAPQPGTRTYEFTHRVTGSDPVGQVSFTAELSDPVGNATTASVGAVEIDTSVPAISNLQVASSDPASGGDPLRLRDGVALTVTFDASEAGTTRVTVGGRAMTCDPPQGIAPAIHHTCWRAVASSDVPGSSSAQTVLASVTDAAGNTGTGTSTVLYDFAAPSLTASPPKLVPAPDNPLQTVTAARPGTQVWIQVISDEPLGAAPTQVPGPGPTFTAVDWSPGATTATMIATVEEGTADGLFIPSFTAPDLAGNVASAAPPGFRVTTSPPELVVDQDALVFVRSPWGNAADEPLGPYTIPAGPYFALEPSDALTTSATLPAGALTLRGGATPAIVFVQTSSANALVVGVLRPDGRGEFPRQPLISPDVAGISLVGVDEAGNRSAAVKVRDAEWVATPNPPAFGTSPHTLLSTPIADRSRDQPLAVPLAGARGWDGDSVVVPSQAVWTDRSRSGELPGPRPRYSPAVAYDSARGRIVVFGGEISVTNVAAQDTWEWTGTGWARVATTGPTPRHQHAMAYDAARARVVLFGGQELSDSGRFVRGDTWEWDGTTWTQVATAGPGPRYSHALAYDPVRGTVLLFGGCTDEGTECGRRFDDTWEWDGAVWTSLATPGPSARYEHAMAHDGARGRVVLFGGRYSGEQDAHLGDTWLWNGMGWTSADTPGPARSRHALAYDAATEQVVLFGGSGPASSWLADTWTWDGTSWTSVAVSGPGPLCEHAMAYDDARGQVVLFGGNHWVYYMNETWIWDGALWTSVPATAPSARSGHAMAYDGDSRRTWLYGGAAPNAMSDTWSWNGAGWTSVPVSGPGAREAHAMAYDGERRRTVLFGGTGTPSPAWPEETWEWDGMSWASVASSGPSPRSEHAMAHDGARGRTVLFGGRSSQQTWMQDAWEWDGSGWASITAAGPGARNKHAMAYDSVRRRTVLFGGEAVDGWTASDEVWEWDGSHWTSLGAAGPGPRFAHAMAYDTALGRTVLFGGSAEINDRRRDTWAWDGTGWTFLTSSGPPPRYSPAMVYDAARRRTVLFGGRGSAGLLEDTWELNADPARTPAIQFQARAGIGVDAARISRATVRAFAGATFDPSAGTSVGATLLGWSVRGPGSGPGEWLPLPGATNQTGVAPSPPHVTGAASRVSWTSSSPEEARRYLVEREGFAFQVRPSGGAGAKPDGASVALDYIEVRVRYTAP